MDYLHGPLGFTSFDNSGILVEGFDELPTSNAHYNYPYYGPFVEKCGYSKEIDWVEYKLTVPEKVPENVTRCAQVIKQRYRLHEVKIKYRKEFLQYADDIFNLVNVSYKDLPIFSEINQGQKIALSQQFLRFLKPGYVSLIQDEQDNLVGLGISTPSIAKALKKCNGRLFPFGFLRIFRALKKNDTVDLLLIAIRPDLQNKGLHAIIFDKIMHTLIRDKIIYVESNRELEDNTKVNNLWHHYEHRQHKRVRCYYKKLI
jgi:hypothetical protein